MNILFVCTGNTCRSPMGKILLEAKADEKNLLVNTKSRGISINPKDRMSQGTFLVLKDHGFDGSFHQARKLEEKDLAWADWIYTMTRTQSMSLKIEYPAYSEKIKTLGPEDVSDPFGGTLEDYEETYAEIDMWTDAIIEKMEKGEL